MIAANSVIDTIMGGPLKFVILVVIVYLIFFIPWTLKMKKGKDNAVADFKKNNPDYCTIQAVAKLGVATDNIAIVEVDGATARQSSLGNENAYAGDFVQATWGNQPKYLLKPGKHVLSVAYSNTRPGVMHKTVTKDYGTTKQEVNCEASKTYTLSFNRKEERFELKEA